MCLSYIGGKSKIGKWIVPFIPNDIETYVESFSGMFWVFFNMDLEKYPNLKNVVYNDFNSLNVNLFNCIRNYKEFSEVIIKYETQNRNLFNVSQKELFDPNFKVDLSKPDYHTGAKYSLILTQVWSGMNPSTSGFIDLKGKYKSKFDTFKDKLQNPKWQKLFDKINTTENLDFEDVMKKYDNEKTYFYLDPPYFYLGEAYYANHEFGYDTHKRLADSLKSIRGKFAMSYYYFDELEQWFPKDKYTWESKEFAKASMAQSGKVQTKGTELLVMNY